MVQPELTSGTGQEFFQGLPIIDFPAGGEVLAQAFGEGRVVENEFGAGTFGGELEFCDRERTGIPIGHAPGLDDALIGDEFEMASQDKTGEKRERAADFAVDFRWGSAGRQAGLHGITQEDDAMELFCFGERFVDALAVCLENNFLMNGFRGMRDFLASSGPCFS